MNLQKQCHQHIVLKIITMISECRSFNSKLVLLKHEFKKMPTENEITKRT